MGMFSQNEILLMIGVVSILLLIITILTILDIMDYFKNKKNIELEKEYFEEEPILNKEESPINKNESLEVLEISNPQDEIMIQDVQEEIEPFMEEESVEIEPIKKEEQVIIDPIVEEIPVKKIVNYDKEAKVAVDLEKELNKAIETIPNEKDAVTKFEEEQERTAIISLDELIKKSDELYNDNEIVQYDDGNEPITIDEVIERFKAPEEKQVPEPMQDIIEEKPVYTHKETIPFISSLYGIEKDSNSLEFENTATYEKLSRSKTNEFMTKLREMNENK